MSCAISDEGDRSARVGVTVAKVWFSRAPFSRNSIRMLPETNIGDICASWVIIQDCTSMFTLPSATSSSKRS